MLESPASVLYYPLALLLLRIDSLTLRAPPQHETSARWK